MNIPAALFKAECLKLMDQVARTGKSIVITKHGRPVAQLAPVPVAPKSLFGYMRNNMRLVGDVESAHKENWSAISGDEDALSEPASGSRRARSHK
jgi:prevent-host-death family protein